MTEEQYESLTDKEKAEEKNILSLLSNQGFISPLELIPEKAKSKKVLLKAIYYNAEQGTCWEHIPELMKKDKDIVIAGIRREHILEEKDVPNCFIKCNDLLEDYEFLDNDIELAFFIKKYYRKYMQNKTDIDSIMGIFTFYYQLQTGNFGEEILESPYVNFELSLLEYLIADINVFIGKNNVAKIFLEDSIKHLECFDFIDTDWYGMSNRQELLQRL